MERVYVRFAPGTSLEAASRQLNDMGRTLREGLPRGAVELVLTNVGSPNNARSAMTSPNAGPHMGFIRVELTPAEHRRESQREIADRMRALLNGRYHVSVHDIQALARAVLRHRIIPNFYAESERITSDILIERLLEAVPTPRSGM